MFRRMKHTNGFPWRFVSTDATKRTLSVVLTVALVLSTIPIVAVRAFAEEITPGLEAIAETVGDALENLAPEEEPAAPAEEVAPAEEPAVEAAPAEEVAPAVEAASAAEVTPAAKPEAPKSWTPPTQTFSTTRKNAPGDAPDNVSVTAYGPTSEDTPLEDGNYGPLDIILQVVALSSDSTFSPTDLPTVVLTFKDAAGVIQNQTYELSNDDSADQQWIVGGGGYIATVHASASGTYISASICGGSISVGGETTELKGSDDFDSQFTIEGSPVLSGIWLLDEDGKVLVDEDDNPINLTTSDDTIVTDAYKAAVRVTGYSLATTSGVGLYLASGFEIFSETFEAEEGVEHSYIAVFDGSGPEWSSDGLPEGALGFVITGTDEAGNWIQDPAARYVGIDGQAYILIRAEQTGEGAEFKADSTFAVDHMAPTVTVDYPSSDLVTPYDPEASDSATANAPSGIDYFGAAPEITITITDYDIDYDTTTVFGTSLTDIAANPASAISGVACSFNESTDSDGHTVVTIVATCGEGMYTKSEVVVANDINAEHETVRWAESGTFIVDMTAPTVTAAAFGSTPYDLGNDADGNPIVNGADNNGNRVYFVKADTSSITLTVSEPYGIRSVEFYDQSGTYVGKLAPVSPSITAGNYGITEASHTGVYEFQVIDGLTEGVPFADDMLFVITDFANNQYYWNMSEQGWTGTVDKDLLNPVTAADLVDASGKAMNHPTLLVPDETGPEIALEGPEDRTDATKPEYKRVYQDAQDVVLNLVDSSIAYLQGFAGGDATYDPNGFIDGTFDGLDPNRVVLTIDYTSDDGSPSTHEITIANLDIWGTDSDTFGWDYTCELDGDYEISADFADVTGQSVNESLEKFTIDTTAPVVEITYDADTSGFFFDQPVTATITVTERNFDLDFFTVTASLEYGAKDAVAPERSAWSNEGNTHNCRVTFAADGSYRIAVEGKDMAGNEASPVDGGPFIIDTEAPAISKYYANGTAPAASFDADDPVSEIPAATGTYNDGSGIVYYFTHAIDVDVKIQDRNFYDKGTVLYVTKDGAESELDVTWEGSETDYGPNGRILKTTTVSYTEDGVYLAPHVIATDQAGNESDNAADAQAMRLVLDLNPPELQVNVNRDPSAQGMDGGNPVNFYNQSTTMTFTVDDAHGLRSVEVEDPDGIYTVSKSAADAEGKDSVTFTVTLQDGSGSQDAEFDRDITLTAEDLAGNSRTWSISPTGRITQDSVTSQAENVGINGGNEYPLALIQDTVAPVVALSGTTAGTYYNSPQSVTATVNEYNMDYLQQFDGGRTIVTVTNWSADASRTQSTWTISANQFSGSRPDYGYVQNFDTDGHYSVTAQFQDFAGNLSNQVTIGEFTIDMTAPQISISWDNNDARSGNYYKDTRTATITVVEHNFDSSRFSINTTGTIGSWSDNGDTHTITVFFGEGSAHTLSVSGSDLAGNEATPVSEPTFIVDLTAPEISIAGLAQRLGFLDDDDPDSLVGAYLGELQDYNAYNGVVVPAITYSDNEALNTEDLAYTIVGNKNGADLEFRTTTTEEAPEMTTTFEDLGYVGPDAGDGSNANEFYVDDYDPDIDDIYTLTATMVDRAGNEAEAQIVFSVNRYGSNYIVTLEGLNAEEEAEYNNSGMLSEAPTIMVREINVCGVDEETGHHVQKEFANVTSAIEQSGGSGAGYLLETIENEDQENGWSEYIYTIRSANFGEGSDSDNNDRGQGTYRVNVMSDDYSSNANSTAAYWSSDSARQAVTADGATTEFILDELAPVIDDLNLPTHFKAGESYEASFHVTDDITSGNKVQVFVDGEELASSEVNGSDGGVGTYTFTIPARAFDWGRSVRILVTDYAGREVEATNDEWLWLSTFIPEGAAIAGVVAVGIAGIVVSRKRKAAQEPELPE